MLRSGTWAVSWPFFSGRLRDSTGAQMSWLADVARKSLWPLFAALPFCEDGVPLRSCWLPVWLLPELPLLA